MKLCHALSAIGLTPGDMTLRQQQYLNVGETCSYSSIELVINEAFKVVQTVQTQLSSTIICSKFIWKQFRDV